MCTLGVICYFVTKFAHKKQVKRSQAYFVSKQYIIRFLILKLYTDEMLFTVGQLKLMNKLVIDMLKIYFR